MQRCVYLDHNATTPLRPEARAAMLSALTTGGNPSSLHSLGRQARRIVEDAREAIARAFGCDAGAVIFTSGGTEANALALLGSGRRRVLISAVEHASVAAAASDAVLLPVDTSGLIDLDALAAALAAAAEPALVSVMLANNETGVIQPLAAVIEVAHAHGALAHTDAVQAAGKLPVDGRDLGADLITISAHKLGGPAGVGALIANVPLAALLRGGGQERGRRAGSENVAGIASFAAAATMAVEGREDEAVRLAGLRDALERGIARACPEAMILGHAAPRLANTSCIRMPGVAAMTQVIAFDLAGFAVSAGAACSSGKVAASRTLRAMGVGEDAAGEAVRISLGWTTREDDVDAFVDAWTAVWQRHARRRLFPAAPPVWRADVVVPS
jgi:cysteine desulfurase